jgi:nucleotide-binding universal stress UspA family protein
MGDRLNPKTQMKLIWAVDPFGKEKKLQRDTALAIKAFTHRLSSVIEPIYVGSPKSLNDPLSSKTDNVQDLNFYGENKLVKILAGVQLPGRQKFNILFAQQANKREEVRALIEYAKTKRSELIVIGTRAHRGPIRWIMGSFAETFAQSSDVPLLVVNPFWKPLRQFKTILFATDFSDHSRAAFKRVLALAKQIKTKIFIFHSLDDQMHVPAEMAFLKHPPISFISKEEIESLRTLGLRWAEEGKREGIKCQVIVDTRIGESPADAILRRSKQLPGIIALAAYSGPVSRALLGSTTRKVIRASTQPVWVIHPQLQKQINEVTTKRPEYRPTRKGA